MGLCLLPYFQIFETLCRIAFFATILSELRGRCAVPHCVTGVYPDFEKVGGTRPVLGSLNQNNPQP